MRENTREQFRYIAKVQFKFSVSTF